MNRWRCSPLISEKQEDDPLSNSLVDRIAMLGRSAAISGAEPEALLLYGFADRWDDQPVRAKPSRGRGSIRSSASDASS